MPAAMCVALTQPQKRRTGARSSSSRQALGFETGIEALFFCFNRHLKNMQILGEFLNPRLNFTMPVTDVRGG